jgi:hypothetical protein
VQPILRFVVLVAYYVWQTTTFSGKAGRLWVKPFESTKAEDSLGMEITTLSYRLEEVDWEIENFTLRLL